MNNLHEHIESAAQHLDRALILLRQRRDQAGHSEEGRRLSVAITQIELGCMAMNSSQFSEKPYTPILQ